jgi:putative acetyltransferase
MNTAHTRSCNLEIRPIQPGDNPAIAAIIRSTLTEFGVNGPGTAYHDAATDNMYASFQLPGSRYHIGLLDGQIAGGGGIYPSSGLPEGVCEMVKMYLAPIARGRGLGKQLIETCLDFARQAGYRQVYIETMPELEKAVSIYERLGFHHLDRAMGNTGHYSCSLWLLKNL